MNNELTKLHLGILNLSSMGCHLIAAYLAKFPQDENGEHSFQFPEAIWSINNNGDLVQVDKVYLAAGGLLWDFAIPEDNSGDEDPAVGQSSFGNPMFYYIVAEVLFKNIPKKAGKVVGRCPGTGKKKEKK